MYKRKEINGYVNGKKIVKNLVALALEQNKIVKAGRKELRAHFPEIIFKVE